MTERSRSLPSSGEDDPMGFAVGEEDDSAARHGMRSRFISPGRFPNRKAWSRTVVGNYYCKAFPMLGQPRKDILPQIPQLEQKTLGFVGALLGSSYPEVVKEAALFNSSALRSQTAFRIADGHLMGWEGVMDRFGSCEGSCTHVWNYEVATPFLYGAWLGRCATWSSTTPRRRTD
jgi:non-lysosomal glucosylceramidase